MTIKKERIGDNKVFNKKIQDESSMCRFELSQ